MACVVGLRGAGLTPLLPPVSESLFILLGIEPADCGVVGWPAEDAATPALGEVTAAIPLLPLPLLPLPALMRPEGGEAPPPLALA